MWFFKRATLKGPHIKKLQETRREERRKRIAAYAPIISAISLLITTIGLVVSLSQSNLAQATANRNLVKDLNQEMDSEKKDRSILYPLMSDINQAIVTLPRSKWLDHTTSEADFEKGARNAHDALTPALKHIEDASTEINDAQLAETLSEVSSESMVDLQFLLMSAADGMPDDKKLPERKADLKADLQEAEKDIRQTVSLAAHRFDLHYYGDLVRLRSTPSE